MTIPLGIRSNNPGNLRPGIFPWRGQEKVENNYCIFDTPFNGIRAMAKQLLVYQNKHGCRTIWKIVSRWAPPHDNNDVQAYVDDVCKRIKKNQYEVLNLKDKILLRDLVTAMIFHENGQQPYAAAIIAAAVDDALKG